MKIATFCTENRQQRIGIVVGDEIADLTAIDDVPASVPDLLNQPNLTDQIGPLIDRAPRRPLEQVTLTAPIPAPPKYWAIGLNSRDHRREVNPRWLLRQPKLVRIAAGYALAHPRPRYPFFFAKATSSITGPFDPIWLPRTAEQVDWEGELAVAVAHHLHDATPEQAQRAIGGYLVANDVSIRDWQTDNPTSTSLAKSYPSHGPLGPWLVTGDELDPCDLEVRTYLNGQLRQRGRISDLIHDPAQVLSHLSRFCVLAPGDIVACGTFAGTGWPAGRFLQAGDTVRVGIDGIGDIANPVTATPSHLVLGSGPSLTSCP